MRYVTGGGCLGYSFSVGSEGYCEVIKGHSFKLKKPLQYDVEFPFPLLAGVKPKDFPEPCLEALKAEQALPPSDPPPELVDSPVFPREEVLPQPIADGADGREMDAGEVGEGPEPMTIDRVDGGQEGEDSEEEEGDMWLNDLILQTQADVWSTCCLRESGCVFPVSEGNCGILLEDFGDQKIRVDIPERSFDELTEAALDLKQVRSTQLGKISKEILPKLEEIYKDREKQGEDTPLTAEGEARYRRVLGQLAWAALSRADLCFSVSYLARFQSKPSGAAEACLRWLLTRLHRVQTMPSPEGSPSVGPRSVVGFCDAFWNVASVSGGVLMFQGCCIKVFSRKQECPALSSAEAELCAMTENSKELVPLGMLLESILDGIPLTILGTPQCTTGTYQLVLRNDATAAISISSMEGLLRRVRHIELRAKYIQMLVKKKRLLLEHIPRLQNPSDGLTKSFKTRDMLINFERKVGLVPGLNTNSLSWIRTFLRRLQLLAEEGEMSSLLEGSVAPEF